ncbi:kinase-like protein [Aspergillus heteromorphus CBS 117.55]|uniref:Kinase-like protein n=1 Tax=Aspergillus heteromorphus CBS 117.55 TaxID=1448321 RepID=A0A317VI69_9EURO|nr:kinase-like protein [Aspergillus heteromorphus CBS 117.55]PWY72891.1 kinase-like protein [Aspergillus heteromorphus CBS 117.55]
MTSSPPNPRYCAAILSQWDPLLEKRKDIFPIYTDKPLYVGRSSTDCQYTLPNHTISRKHLHIYTVTVDPDNPEETPPLVYAEDISSTGTYWNGYPMAGKGGFLLSDGDVLRLAGQVYLRFRLLSACAIGGEWDGLGRITRVDVNVYMAYENATGKQLACKIIDVRPLRDAAIRENLGNVNAYAGSALVTGKRYEGFWRKLEEKLRVIKREVLLLKDLCHPNIISLEKVIQTSFNIYLVQELVPGGDLFSYIQYKGGKLSNIEAAVIVRQILMALKYLHRRNIVHRDLKPDNILMTSLADGCRVVLSDFGCAIRTTGRMSTMVGTFEYSAPEVLTSTTNRGYTKSVDLWSLGCVTAVLLTGRTSCEDSSRTYAMEMAQDQGHDKLERSLQQHNANRRARSFVHRLLVYDDRGRMTVEQALSHCWFTNPVHQEEFDNLYRRSIRDWSPCYPDEPLIVDLSSSTASLETLSDQETETETEKGKGQQKGKGQRRTRTLPMERLPSVELGDISDEEDFHL